MRRYIGNDRGRLKAATIWLGALLLAGCVGLPSSWRPFGTPLTREAKRASEESQARSDVVVGAQAAVHQAVMALQAAPASRAVEVATDFATEAQTLLDQAQGAPRAGDVARWQSLVDRLLSENAEIRKAADREREKNRESVAAMADKLAEATAAKVRAEQKVREYAAENERLADWIRKAIWIGGALLGVWILGQVLAVASRFNPAFAGASAVVNGVAAPAVQFVANRAHEGLRRVGKGMKTLRTLAGDKADELIERSFDGVTDDDHQRAIASGAK